MVINLFQLNQKFCIQSLLNRGHPVIFVFVCFFGFACLPLNSIFLQKKESLEKSRIKLYC